MEQKNHAFYKTSFYFLIILTVFQVPGYNQTSIGEEIKKSLTDIDTLDGDSLKLWTIFNLAGRKYRYTKEIRPLLNRCHEIAKNSKIPLAMANYQYAMGNFFFYNSLLDSSAYYLEKALANDNVATDAFLHSQILATQSGIQKINGQVSQSLETMLTAKKILEKIDTIALNRTEKIKRKGQLSILDNSIGNLFNSLGDHRMAIQHYLHAYNGLYNLGDLIGAGSVMGNMGEVYLNSLDYNRALESLQKALKLKQSGKAPERSIAMTYFNIGRVLNNLGQIA